MNRLLRWVFALGLLARWIGSMPAEASGTFETQTPDATAPVRIDACQARSLDASIPDFYFQVGLRFADASDDTAVAVRFRFRVRNTFGEDLGSTYLVQEGTFSPGAEIDKMGWYQAVNTYGSSGTVECTVDTVRFVTGNVWHAGDSGANSGQSSNGPGPSAASLDVNGLDCRNASLTHYLGALSAVYSAGGFALMEIAAPRFIAIVSGCEVQETGTSLALSREDEALGHSWRALALIHLGRTDDAVAEESKAISIELPLFTDPSLPATMLPALTKNYAALINRRRVLQGGVASSPAATAPSLSSANQRNVLQGSAASSVAPRALSLPSDDQHSLSARNGGRKVHVAFGDRGSGSHTSERFAVAADWDLKWAFDCADYGTKGNFAVTPTANAGNVGEFSVNQLAQQGEGVEHYHGGAGLRYLAINSECRWVVEAVSL